MSPSEGLPSVRGTSEQTPVLAAGTRASWDGRLPSPHLSQGWVHCGSLASRLQVLWWPGGQGLRFPPGVNMQSDPGRPGTEQVSSRIQCGHCARRGPGQPFPRRRASEQTLSRARPRFWPPAVPAAGRLQRPRKAWPPGPDGAGGVPERRAGPQPAGPQMPHNTHLSR